MDSPKAEIAFENSIDESFVRLLLGKQHSDLSDLPLNFLNVGWDNSLWRLGTELLVRIPRRKRAVAGVKNELQWLPSIAGDLPLLVPIPVRLGAPSEVFPWPWSIVPWIEGTAGDQAPISELEQSARALGQFLRALHREAPVDAPKSPWRGQPLSNPALSIDTSLLEHSHRVDVGTIREIWNLACTAKPWIYPGVWIHGDLHPANTIITDGCLTGVIDFNDLSVGDPATDIAAMWMLFPNAVYQTFVDAYGTIEPELEARSLGWAIRFALMLLSIGIDPRPESGHPSYAQVAVSTISRVIERHKLQ